MNKILIPLCLTLLMQSAFSHDGLGKQFTESTNDPSKKMVAAQMKNPSFYVQTMVENGTTIKQYISTSNQIFAITWSGITQPDLSKLLGDYTNIPTTNTSTNTSIVNHKNMISEGNDFVIAKHHVGQLKNGFAYVKSLLPKDFDISSLSN